MVDVQAFASRYFQMAGIETQLLQDRGVDVGDIVPVLYGVETDFIRHSMDDAPFDSTAGHPDGKTVDVVIASIGTLRSWRLAEFAGKQHNGRIQQATLLQVLQQAGDRLVDRFEVAFVVRF